MILVSKGLIYNKSHKTFLKVPLCWRQPHPVPDGTVGWTCSNEHESSFLLIPSQGSARQGLQVTFLQIDGHTWSNYSPRNSNIYSSTFPKERSFWSK